MENFVSLKPDECFWKTGQFDLGDKDMEEKRGKRGSGGYAETKKLTKSLF